MAGFKKVVITSFIPERKGIGKMRFTETLTLRSSIVANDFEQARTLVEKTIQMHVFTKKMFTVQWKRDGLPEGYMVCDTST